jgi:hypothetical protein
MCTDRFFKILAGDTQKVPYEDDTKKVSELFIPCQFFLQKKILTWSKKIYICFPIPYLVLSGQVGTIAPRGNAHAAATYY